MKTPIFFICRR